MSDGGESDKKPENTGPSFRERLPQILAASFLVLNVGVMGGGVAAVYYFKVVFKRPPITEETENKNLEHDRKLRGDYPIYLTMDRFVVNLDGHPRKVLSTVINLEMLNENGYEEVVQLGPKTRDNIVRIFNNTKYEDLESVQGKLVIKDKIITVINNDLHQATVKDLFFGEFTVQRL